MRCLKGDLGRRQSTFPGPGPGDSPGVRGGTTLVCCGGSRLAGFALKTHPATAHFVPWPLMDLGP